MKKVVLLAPYFLPRRRVGSWRPFKFAVHLREYGWEPHVITIQEPRESLTDKERRLLTDIPIYPIKSPFDFTHQLGTQLEFDSRLSSSASSSKLNLPAQKVLSFIDKHFPIDTWVTLFFLRKRYIINLVEDINPHLLWSTGDPWSSHWMARKIVEKVDIPWIADYRDPWTPGEVNVRDRSDFIHRIDQQQEKKIIKKASVLTFTAHQTQALYNDHFGSELKRTETIYNSFDSSLFEEIDQMSYQFEDRYLNLIFFGKYRPLSPAEPFIDILHTLYKQYPKIAKKVRMFSFGSLSDKETENAKAKNVYANFISLKPVDLENALSVLSMADILWLSTHPDRKNIIPAKLWDYLPAKRPVLSIAPNPEIKQILQQTGSGEQYDHRNFQPIIDTLCAAVKAKERGEPIPIKTTFNDNAIKQYDARVSTKKLADLFERMVSYQ